MNCVKWKKNGVNPLTNRKISPTGKVGQTMKKLCNEIKCNDWDPESNVNPITGRKLKAGSATLKFIGDICDDKSIVRAPRTTRRKPASPILIETVNHQLTASPLLCTEYRTTVLKDHQKKVCKFIQDHDARRMILFHSVGSGKTLTSITVIRCILRQTPNKKVFVITPTSLVENFHKEMKKHDISFPRNVVVISHVRFLNKVKTSPAFARNSCLVIDEAHNFKTPVREGAKRVKLLFKATAIASHVFMLTATPVQNSKSEISNLYAIATNRETEIQQVTNEISKADAETLRDMFEGYVSYFKSPIGSDYPSVVYKDITTQMEPAYYTKYTYIENEERDKFNIFSSGNLTVFYNGVRRAVNHLDDTVPSPKVEWSVKFIKREVKAKRKVLVYSNWLKSGMELIQKRLKAEKINYVTVNGSMTQKNKMISVRRFNNNEVFVLFISSSGAEGLDLKETRSVIIMEPHWNNSKIAQVIGRAVRYKSHASLPEAQRNVTIYSLILEKPEGNEDKLPSADTYLTRMAKAKEEKIEEFYDALIYAAI